MRWQHTLDGNILIEIGKLLKNLRVNNKFTQQELGDKIGVSRKLIGEIEKGSNTSLLIIIKLLKVYNRVDKLEELLFSNSISPKQMFLKNK
jgi:transcriptional regulator with XRE-family HTH domain